MPAHAEGHAPLRQTEADDQGGVPGQESQVRGGLLQACPGLIDGAFEDEGDGDGDELFAEQKSQARGQGPAVGAEEGGERFEGIEAHARGLRPPINLQSVG